MHQSSHILPVCPILILQTHVFAGDYYTPSQIFKLPYRVHLLPLNINSL